MLKKPGGPTSIKLSPPGGDMHFLHYILILQNHKKLDGQEMTRLTLF